ncbi:CrcB protein [Catalinimonas alkaloidigena]|uniref:Fluoride-specific ion channel FluC n=1 Tax=Catalinimonas alkaloidigena TaxID=1075417 RepID=A0A1G9F481_9BACT|nr:fluoride efflux transporter CrcB [Catalinimonas alkaloidigena]SDK83043.1 CrcB protein [Catalinimonas alkaloidigena]
MKLLLWVGVGGFFGSMARYGISLYAQRWWPGFFPWGTLLANVLGCLLIGVFLVLAARQQWELPTKLLLATGFCGGFTTFSTFSYESLLLLREGRPGGALLYMGVSLGLGLLATAAGMWLGRQW